MQYTQRERMDLKISRLTLGTMHFVGNGFAKGNCYAIP